MNSTFSNCNFYGPGLQKGITDLVTLSASAFLALSKTERTIMALENEGKLGVCECTRCKEILEEAHNQS